MYVVTTQTTTRDPSYYYEKKPVKRVSGIRVVCAF